MNSIAHYSAASFSGSNLGIVLMFAGMLFAALFFFYLRDGKFRFFPDGLRSVDTSNWPVVTAAISISTEEEHSDHEAGEAEDHFHAQFTYTFTPTEVASGVELREYASDYGRCFETQAEAEAWVELVKSKTIQIQYNPEGPDDSFVLDEEL